MSRRVMAWQLQEAKQRFSELVRRTLDEGPQTVTRNGEAVVVVVPASEFRHGGEPDLARFLLEGPAFDDLDLSDERQLPRETGL